MSIKRVVLGTAALGMPYGLRASKSSDLPKTSDSAKILSYSNQVGILHYDTAPSYGGAERVLGQHLKGNEKKIWTKLSDLNARQDIDAANLSIQNTLQTLQVNSIEFLQWHNWTESLGKQPNFMKLWDTLKQDSRIHALGASTYGVNDALSAVKSGLFDLVQIEWNLLNQSVLEAVEMEAANRGVKIALRSIFLQGVLTQEGNVLPEKLQSLVEPRDKAIQIANQLGLSLNELAFLSALNHRSNPFVLVGVDRYEQLEELVGFTKKNALPSCAEGLIKNLSVQGNPLVDPRNW